MEQRINKVKKPAAVLAACVLCGLVFGSCAARGKPVAKVMSGGSGATDSAVAQFVVSSAPEASSAGVVSSSAVSKAAVSASGSSKAKAVKAAAKSAVAIEPVKTIKKTVYTTNMPAYEKTALPKSIVSAVSEAVFSLTSGTVTSSLGTHQRNWIPWVNPHAQNIASYPNGAPRCIDPIPAAHYQAINDASTCPKDIDAMFAVGVNDYFLGYIPDCFLPAQYGGPQNIGYYFYSPSTNQRYYVQLDEIQEAACTRSDAYEEGLKNINDDDTTASFKQFAAERHYSIYYVACALTYSPTNPTSGMWQTVIFNLQPLS